MKYIFTLLLTFILFVTISNAQTAMPLSGNDCNGVYHDVYADLDAGKAVLLHFFMTCAACPPPAQKIQAMANNILATHPGTITGYALGYTNTYSCATVASWVTTNNLSLYAPFDSGATQVAYYGGFGMPTVVLLGGADHRVMFSTQSFSTSDTTIIRDSILALLSSTSGIQEMPDVVSSFSAYPNPASSTVSINLNLKESSNPQIDVTDISGKLVTIISIDEVMKGNVTKQFNVETIPNGNYFVRLHLDGKTVTQKITITH